MPGSLPGMAERDSLLEIALARAAKRAGTTTPTPDTGPESYEGPLYGELIEWVPGQILVIDEDGRVRNEDPSVVSGSSALPAGGPGVLTRDTSGGAATWNPMPAGEVTQADLDDAIAEAIGGLNLDARLGAERDVEDGLEGLLVARPAAGTQESALVVVAPDSDWAYDAQALDVYGGAQAWVVLKEDPDGTLPLAERVLARLNGLGGMGIAGGMHVATGLRARPGQAFSYSINIEPEVDVPGLIIQQGGAGTAAFLLLFDEAGTEVGKITDGGALQLDGAITTGGAITATGDIRTDGTLAAENDNAALNVLVGNRFGAPSVQLGTTGNDAYVHGLANGVLGLNPGGKIVELMAASALELGELAADAAAPAANKGRLYLKDNGSGKTQLCVRFNTGAVAVLATQP